MGKKSKKKFNLLPADYQPTPNRTSDQNPSNSRSQENRSQNDRSFQRSSRGNNDKTSYGSNYADKVCGRDNTSRNRSRRAEDASLTESNLSNTLEEGSSSTQDQARGFDQNLSINSGKNDDNSYDTSYDQRSSYNRGSENTFENVSVSSISTPDQTRELDQNVSDSRNREVYGNQWRNDRASRGSSEKSYRNSKSDSNYDNRGYNRNSTGRQNVQESSNPKHQGSRWNKPQDDGDFRSSSRQYHNKTYSSSKGHSWDNKRADTSYTGHANAPEQTTEFDQSSSSGWNHGNHRNRPQNDPNRTSYKNESHSDRRDNKRNRLASEENLSHTRQRTNTRYTDEESKPNISIEDNTWDEYKCPEPTSFDASQANQAGHADLQSQASDDSTISEGFKDLNVERGSQSASADSFWWDGERELEKQKSRKKPDSKSSETLKHPRMERDKTARPSTGSRRERQASMEEYFQGDDDKGFREWCKMDKRKQTFSKVSERQEDLFAMPKEYSLAHCVAEDMRMGSGIAVHFKAEFKNLADLLDQRAKQGGLAVLESEDRYIYYLVTKRLSTGKPTNNTMWRSLKKMRDHVAEHEVKKLAIPRLGCGLDRLEWSDVKSMLELIFQDVDVEIVVCNFQQSEESSPKPSSTPNTCRIVRSEKSITEIGKWTIIIYLSTASGHVSEEMEKLDKKFNFLRKFQDKKPKNLGDAIFYEDFNQGYTLCGCIVRNSPKDPVHFSSLGKCVSEINKYNRKQSPSFEYVAFQDVTWKDYHDELVNEKVLTIFINHLRKVEIHVCN